MCLPYTHVFRWNFAVVILVFQQFSLMVKLCSQGKQSNKRCFKTVILKKLGINTQKTKIIFSAEKLKCQV